MQKFLITSGYQISWNLEDQVLFLNELCISQANMEDLKKVDYEICKPFGLTMHEKDENEEIIINVLKSIENDLYNELNHVHNVNYSHRYWKILLGHWLKRFLKVVFNRYMTLQSAIYDHNPTSVNASNFDDYTNSINLSKDFYSASNDNEWNYNLLSKILRFAFDKKIKINYLKSKNYSFLNTTESSLSLKDTIRIIIENFFGFFLKRVIKEECIFIKNSSLTFFQEIKLNIYLNKVPAFWRSPKTKLNKFNKKLRDKIRLNHQNFNTFENLARYLIPDALPNCFIESYLSIKNLTEKMNWPRKPKLIFTANSYDTDEIFKFWTASKTENKTMYIVAQHGHSHGNHVLVENNNEYQTCDKFLNWGFSEKDKHVKLFNLQVVGQKIRSLSNGKLLIVNRSMGDYDETYDRYYVHQKYVKSLQELLSNLPSKILKLTLARLRKGNHKDIEVGSPELKMIKEFFPDLAYEEGLLKLEKLKKESRLIIYMYNSTGILENLSLNFPTMCYWPDRQHSLNSELFNKYLELLIDSEILASSPKSLASNVLKNWNDIDAWWFSDKVQSARNEFCDEFSIIPPLGPLKNFSEKLKAFYKYD